MPTRRAFDALKRGADMPRLRRSFQPRLRRPGRVGLPAAAGLILATHTVKIVVLGTAGHPRVDLDTFVILR
jgi:hypothetical protein